MIHVAEERLEDFARRDCVPCTDFAEVHEHVAECPWCQDRLSEMHEFVAFMRAAPGETEGQIRQRHDTDQGTVFLVVTGADATLWEARVLGGGWNIEREFTRGAQAKTYLENWFETAFPGHRCERGCGRGWQ